MKTITNCCRSNFYSMLIIAAISIGCSTSGSAVKSNQEPDRIYITLLDRLRHEPQLTISGSDNNPNIRIRGSSSIEGENEPLFVLDGTPLGNGYHNATSVDVNEVANIRVLPAAQAGLYGSRGANGVVLIYTK